MLKKSIAFVFLFGTFLLVHSQGNPLYKNPHAQVDSRVKDLLSRMTLAEKIAQTQCMWGDKKLLADSAGNFSLSSALSVIPDGLGQIARPNDGLTLERSLSPKETAILVNTIQKYFVEKTRLGIPVMFHEESLHGNQAKDATNFPSPLGLASTWNPGLISEIFTSVAAEVRARGGHQVLAPVVDLGRDPRWGRTEETLGEDPFLVSKLAVAEVKAYQGTGDVIDRNHVVATLKHFGVHGMPEGGVNVAPSFVDERTLREVYFPSFKASVKEGNVLGVMPCYNELSGIPAHMNKKLLTDVLRNDWGFKGIIVSDYGAVTDLKSIHKVALTDGDAALKSITAGVDIETPNREAYKTLDSLVKSGKLSEAIIDSAVSRILTIKFKLGLFENPYTYPNLADTLIGSTKNREIALKAAREAMVLLKNESDILPLKMDKIKTLAVIGPNADRCILGGYSNEPRQKITPLEGIKKAVGEKIKVLYCEGCKITEKGDWIANEVVLADKSKNLEMIREAVNVAKNADAVVLCVGGNDATSREAWSLAHLGDLVNLDLMGEQDDLIRELKNTGKPIVAFVFSGPPLTFRNLNELVPAIVQCWYLGQETGTAVTEVLFGKCNPSGKLPITIPRSVGHIPSYYNYKPSARRGYQFTDIKPLYPFGHGLSYTTFEYKNLTVSKNKIYKNELAEVCVDIINTGKAEGAETVQLYIRDVVSSVTRPVKELKGFEKIFLKPGEMKRVTFTITPEMLSFYNINMQYIVEPGNFDLMVGGSSEDLQKINLEVVE